MKKLLLLTFFGMLTSWTAVHAQDTITTSPPLTPNNRSSGVTFEIESTQPIRITGLRNIFSTGASTVTVWYKVGAISNPPNISTANGWQQHIIGAPVSGADGTSMIDVASWTDLSVPANQPIAMAIDANNTEYQTGTTGDAGIFTDGTLSVKTGDGYGFGGGSPNPTFSPRQFVGQVIYELDVVGGCTPFTNFLIDSTSATATKVSWTPGTNNNSYYLEYGTTGFTPGTGTTLTGTVSGTAQSLVLTGLSPQTSYDVYFGEICNSGADSAYFPTARTFTTTKLCASPTNFSSSNITPYSVDLSWSQAGAITEYYLIHGPSGFDPSTAGTTDTATAYPYTLTGLVPASTQDIYLVTNCGGGNGISDTIGPITITTACATIATFPWLENFENATVSSGFPQCWADSSAGISWQVNTGTTSSSNTGPSVDHTTDSTIGKYVYIETSSSGGPAYLETPYLDFSGLTNPVLSFWYHAYGATVNKLEVEVSTDSGATWSLVYRFEGQQQASSAAPWQQASVDLGQFKVPHTKVRFVGFGGSSFTGDISIDDVELKEGPACPVPATFLTGVSDTSASFNIVGGGTSYQLEWGPTGFNQGTGCATTTSNGSVTLNNTTDPNCSGGFAGNTTYDLYIRRDCGNGVFSAFVGPITFTTACSPFTAPYSQNFDNTVEPNIDVCWTGVNLSNGSSYVESYDFLQNSAPNSIDIYSGGATDGFVALVSPKFSDLDATKRIEFFYYDEDGSDLIIGTVANPADSASFMPLDTLTGAEMPDDTWTLYILDLTNYTGTNQHIALRHGLNGTFDNIRIDDFAYSVTPTCNPPLITSLSTIQISSNDATLAWGSNSDGNETHISWGTPGFTAGAGIGLDSVSGSIDQYTISSLSPNTSYEVYIRDSCAGSGFSPWVGPLTFRTNCLPLTAPFLEEFDGSAWVASGANTGNSIDPCWSSNPPTSSSSAFKWIPRGTGPSSGNGPISDLTGGNFIYAEASGSGTGDTAIITTPSIDLTSLNAPALYFWQHRYNSNASIGDMYVDVSNDNGATWSNVYSVTGVQQSSSSAAWEDIFVNLPNYVNDTVQLRFLQVSNGCCGDAAIDSIAIDEAPSCPDPAGLQAINVVDSGATVDWTASNNATDHQIWFGPQGFFQGTATVGGVKTFTGSTSGNFILDTLSPNSCYEVLVRSVCQAGDTSQWVGPITFCTPCVPTTMPYFESFDNWTPSCWDVTLGDEDWVSYSGPGNDNYAEASFWTYNAVDMIMESATVIVNQNAQVSFEWSHSYSTSYPDDSLYLRASVEGSGIWETIFSISGPAFDDPNAGNTTPGSFNTEIINLDPATYTGQNVVVQVIGYSDWGPDLFINNFRIGAPVTCYPADSVMATNIVDTAATLTWVDTNVATDFEVWFGPQGFFQGAATNPALGTKVIVTGASSLLVDTLSPSTCYEFAVRSICSAGDTSLWTSAASFCTPCSPLQAPYIADFDLLSSGISGDLGNCWETVGGNYDWETNTGSTGSSNTGPTGDATTGNGVYIYTEASSGSQSDEALLLSPLVDLSALNNPEVRFSYHMYGSDIDSLHVDVFNGTAWQNNQIVLRGQQQTTSAAAWRDTLIDLNSFGNLVQLRFRAYRGSSFEGDISIDDVEFSDPISCPAPTALDTSAVGSSTATLMWTPGTSSNTNFEVEYGQGLFSLGSGTRQSVTGTSFGITGLTPATNYCFYVREICGPNDTSLWAGPFCFNTACLPVITAPYSTNFEGISIGSQLDYENCWSVNTTSGLAWESEDAEGSNENSTNTGPFYDATTPGVPGGTYMYLETSSSGDSAEIYSPFLDISGLSAPELEYAYHMYGDDIERLEVYAEDQSGNRTFLDSIVGEQQTAGSDSFAIKAVPMGNVTYTTMRLVFVGYYGGSFNGDIAIDEVYVQNGNACPQPSNLSTSSIGCDSLVVNWNNAANAVIQYGLSGFTPGTGTFMSGSQGAATIVGLTPGTAYDVWVAQICASGDTSGYAGPVSVTTATGPLPVANISLVADSIANNMKYFALDASNSSGASSYFWDFGNGTSNSTAAIASYSQSENGPQTIVLTATNGCGNAYDTLVVNVDISLVESKLNASLSMYPNPSDNDVNIEVSSVESSFVTIKLTDLSGKVVMESQAENNNGNVKTKLHTEHLAPGVYMVEVSDGDNTAIRRLVKR